MFLIFDTETTGLPKKWKAPLSDSDNWPRLVQLAWQLHDEHGKLIINKNFIIKPDGFEIPFAVAKIHGITTERAEKDGVDLKSAIDEFIVDLKRVTYNVGHNIEFDINIVGAEIYRLGLDTDEITSLAVIDTKNESVDFCALPGGRGGKFKWPTLTELHTKLFGVPFADAHDAAYDVDATARCFFGLIDHKVIQRKEITDHTLVKYDAPKLDKANFAEVAEEVATSGGRVASDDELNEVKGLEFIHLHNHSQFSILQSTSSVNDLIAKATELNMKSIALTDHGNMMAAFHFVKAALKAGIKPILGCEFNVNRNRTDKSFKDNGYQTVLLAKNKNGYHNLSKLASIAYTEGFYYVPRIDKEILLEYKDDVIALSGGLWGEIPNKILNEGEASAEESLVWWKEHFGDDFYLELGRHGVEEENHVNQVLIKFAAKHSVKLVASNNTYYPDKSASEAHDILLCVKEGVPLSKPKAYFGKKGREFRFGFPNDEFYIKSADEMKKLFADVPEAIASTSEIADKVVEYKLAREVLLPGFDIPEEFQDAQDEKDGGKRGENNYLKHLTFVGAKKRYGEISDEIKDRLDFELKTIENTGYPGYFLIVQDFCKAARDMDVSVGPGRGSAAGSAVAYCIAITNIDPIKYDLLFERFLNPDRISMPDIDIDFDDEGRQRVIDYVINKYGKGQVAQIITYGTMAAKSAIRDTARVLELPLSDADRLAKLVPDMMKLNKLFNLNNDELKSKLNPDQFVMASELKKVSKGSDLAADTLNQAISLEGSVRNTGIHACGVIITPGDITDFVPVAIAKDSDMCCTQFDNSVVEDAGLLKMDFLGLKTLSLIKDTVKIVKARLGVELDPDNFSLEDEKTYELFQRGETVGVFQYESNGMQKYLKELKPTVFADLIAMNALYRPGPLEYIPSFIKRKHGEEKITYDLDDMKEYLEETYGITVYQEQVMLLSQKLAGFSKGEADVLRKAMGKKDLSLLADLKPKFINQAKEKGHDEKKLEKIWIDWEAFASYAFNKSHSTCYAWIAYQTAYLKSHYPSEYMAAVLTHNMNDIKKVTFFMEECRRMGIEVLGPCINESYYKFAVNKNSAIRFGLGAIRGVGQGAVEAIIGERKENGLYKSIFDVTTRIDLRAANKKTLEGLALAGGFDAFEGTHRAQYFYAEREGGPLFLEKAMKYGHAHQENLNSSQHSLFGGEAAIEIPEPLLPKCEEWGTLEKLSKEKDVIGIFISGHPLDDFRYEMQHFCTHAVADLNDLNRLVNKEVCVGGIVVSAMHRISRAGKPFGVLVLEDYSDTIEIPFFGTDYVDFKSYLEPNWFLCLKGRVQARRFDADQLEYKVNRVELLTEVKEKRAKSITLNIVLGDITETYMKELSDLVKQHKGKCAIKLEVEDPVENLKVMLPSKTRKVSVSNVFLQSLDEKKIKFEFNK